MLNWLKKKSTTLFCYTNMPFSSSATAGNRDILFKMKAGNSQNLLLLLYNGVYNYVKLPLKNSSVEVEGNGQGKPNFPTQYGNHPGFNVILLKLSQQSRFEKVQRKDGKIPGDVQMHDDTRIPNSLFPPGG